MLNDPEPDDALEIKLSILMKVKDFNFLFRAAHSKYGNHSNDAIASFISSLISEAREQNDMTSLDSQC